jgi:hypothetical protein
MSRNTLLIAGLALLLAVGALILQFALPSGGGVSRSEFSALENEVANLRQGGGPRIALLDAEEAFTVFTDAVGDLRRRATEKLAEVTELQQGQSGAAALSERDYQQRLMELKAEFLDAQFAVQVAMIDMMIAADGFSDIVGELTQLKERIQPVVDATGELVTTAQVGAMSADDFDSRYSQLDTVYKQSDQLLVNIAAVKVVAAAKEIAIERGFDLVLGRKNVHVYSNPAVIVDITDLVKARVSTYL